MARLRSHRAETALGASTRSSRICAVIGIFLFWWILTALVYDRTPINFLRAESGWYLWLSHSSPTVQQNFVRVLLTKSISGHYAPLGFLAEFETAKLIGTRAASWKWRQITLLTMLATALSFFARSGGAALGLSGLKASLSAFSLTVVLIFQPLMRDFVAWPFMSLQLFWLLFSTLALLSLVRMVQRPTETLWPWLSAGAAYGSLHFLGLGLATVTATAIGMSGLWWGTRRADSGDVSRIAAPLASMAAITTLHAMLMLNSVYRPAIANNWEPIPFLMASLGFIPIFALATLRGLFSAGQPMPDGLLISHSWPYGLAILLGVGFLVGRAFRRSLAEPTVRNRLRFILRSFASTLFLAMIALIWIRQWREPTPHGFADFFASARYLIPSTFALAGIIAELLFLIGYAPLFLHALLNLALGICAILGNLHFAAHVYPKMMPRSMISHKQAWQSVVGMARECRQANLAIPNVPLGALTQGYYDNDLKLFEPLLRADLKLPPGTSLQLRSWEELPDEYYRDVPSLAQVKKRLLLETKN